MSEEKVSNWWLLIPILQVGLVACVVIGIPYFMVSSIQNMPTPPPPPKDVYIGTVTNLSSQNWWFQNHYIITVDHAYTFETDLATWSNFGLGDSIRLGRIFNGSSWQVANVTRLGG